MWREDIKMSQQHEPQWRRGMKGKLKEKDATKVDQTYLMTIIDRMF